MGKSAHVANASGQTARVYVRTGGVNRNFCLNPGDVQKVESKERAYFSVTIDGMTQQMELPPDASLAAPKAGTWPAPSMAMSGASPECANIDGDVVRPCAEVAWM